MALYCPDCGTMQEHPGSNEMVCSSCNYTATAVYWLWLSKDEFFKEWKRLYGDKPFPNWVKQ